MQVLPSSFADYLQNSSSLDADMRFCNLSDADRTEMHKGVDEILADAAFLARLTTIATSVLGPREAFDESLVDFLPKTSDSTAPSPTSMMASRRFGLVYALLSNLPALKEAYSDRSIPMNILADAMLDIPRWIDTVEERSQGRWRAFEQISWLRESFNLRLFTIGRLQFQPAPMDSRVAFLRNRSTGELRLIPAEERSVSSFPSPEWEDVCKPGDPVLSVHIPCGEKLDPTLCRQAIETAPAFFQKFFPDQPAPMAMQCDSWLLFRDLPKLLPANSNIIGFKNLFVGDVPCGTDALFWERCFIPLGRNTKPEQAHTSLQRALLDYVAAGNALCEGFGMIAITPPEKLRIGVLGSGSGSNMQSIQDAIENGTLNAEIVTVISDVPDAGILARAERHGLPNAYMDPAPFKTKLEGPAEDEVIRVLREARVDVVVLAGYMRVVKPKLLSAFPNRVLNIHPAVLPSFPGIAGWKQALDYGAKVAGCTVHFVNAGIDSGPIIVQRIVPVLDNDTPASLHARIQVEEHIAYPEALRLLASRKLLVSGRRVFSLA